MKAKFLKIAGVKNEEQFYKKYPTESAFFKAHPEAKKQIKKAEVGSYIGGDLDVISEPQSFQQYSDKTQAKLLGKSTQEVEAERLENERIRKEAAANSQQGGIGGMLGPLQQLLKVIPFGGSDFGGSEFGDIAGGGADMLTPGIGDIGSSVDVGSIAKKGKKISKAEKGDVLGKIVEGLPIIGNIFQGVNMIKDLKQQRKEIERSAKISDVALQASQTQPERTQKRYVRPEDAIVSPNERFVPGGTGTEILAEYGASIGGNPTEIQNMYNPGDLYSNLGYEPLSESDIIKQYRKGGSVPKAASGFMEFMGGAGGGATNSLISSVIPQKGGIGAGSQIGGGIGKGVGMIFGPAGAAIGEAAGSLLGAGVGAIADAPGAKKQKRNEKKIKSNTETMVMQDSVRGALGNYSSFVKNGGDIPYAEYGWVSHDWQPQKIVKWGDINVQDVDGIFRPDDMKTLENGGGVQKAQTGKTPLLPSNPSAYTDSVLTANKHIPYYAELLKGKAPIDKEEGLVTQWSIRGEDDSEYYNDPYGKTYASDTYVRPRHKYVGGKHVPITNMEELYTEGSSDIKFPTQFAANIFNNEILRRANDKVKKNRTGGSIRQNYLSELDQFNFGGSLKTHWGGRAEVDSYNPYLPGTGETVMFKGNQHSESDGTGKTGIGVSYGPKEHDSYTDYAEYGSEQAADVEVENGEPATQLPDANGDLSMTVFGALKIDKNAAMEIGDPEAEGLTYKKFVERVNDNENKANKKLAKANEELQDLKVNTPFDRLKLNSLQSTIQGADQKLKQLAILKTNAAGVQNAYNETADELGLDADALAKGKIKAAKSSNMAKYGRELEKAQRGIQSLDTTYATTSKLSDVGRPTEEMLRRAIAAKTAADAAAKSAKKSSVKKRTSTSSKKQADSKPSEVKLSLQSQDRMTPEERNDMMMKEILKGAPKEATKLSTPTAKVKDKSSKTNWTDFAKAAITQLGPLLRRPLQEDLDPSQLYGEMLAKAQNQLAPVQAQTFQPLLDTPFDVSFQDKLNENQASFNALLRNPALANNPAALSALVANKYQADSQVLADQFRTNQAMRTGVFSKNRETLNEAALKNLAILDQQYTRQAEAISKTKATDLAIANSISDKIAKNKLENRTLAAYSNLFPQYGFNRNMLAFSQMPTFFNTGNVPGLSPEDAKEFQEWYDKKLKTKEEEKKTTTGKYGKELKKHFKNGNIVKSFKG